MKIQNKLTNLSKNAGKTNKTASRELNKTSILGCRCVHTYKSQNKKNITCIVTCTTSKHMVHLVLCVL